MDGESWRCFLILFWMYFFSFLSSKEEIYKKSTLCTVLQAKDKTWIEVRHLSLSHFLFLLLSLSFTFSLILTPSLGPILAPLPRSPHYLWSCPFRRSTHHSLSLSLSLSLLSLFSLSVTFNPFSHWKYLHLYMQFLLFLHENQVFWLLCAANRIFLSWETISTYLILVPYSTTNFQFQLMWEMNIGEKRYSIFLSFLK